MSLSVSVHIDRPSKELTSISLLAQASVGNCAARFCEQLHNLDQLAVESGVVGENTGPRPSWGLADRFGSATLQWKARLARLRHRLLFVVSGQELWPQADPATERRKSGLFQVGAASARARRPFAQWDAKRTLSPVRRRCLVRGCHRPTTPPLGG
jgi:hypothetical protein